MKLHENGGYSSGGNIAVEGDLFVYTGCRGEHYPYVKTASNVKFLEPMNSTLNYFEYEIIASGTEDAIGIGVGDLDYPLDKTPGRKQNGVGYHADDGNLYHQKSYGKQFGPTCTKGDRMGCGVDFDSEDTLGYIDVFFTKNGEQVGDVIKIKKPTSGLYSVVGLFSEGGCVRYLGHWHHHTPINLLKVSIL